MDLTIELSDETYDALIKFADDNDIFCISDVVTAAIQEYLGLVERK
jgi:hypothetical protein